MYKKTFLFLGSLFLGGMLVWRLAPDEHKRKFKKVLYKRIQSASLDATQGLLKRFLKKVMIDYIS